MAKFGIQGIGRALDVVQMQQRTRSVVRELRLRLKAMSPSLHKVYTIDEISSEVTTSADTATAIAQLHPSKEFQQSALQALEDVSALMRELNADPLFYWSLVETRLNPVFRVFSAEQQRFVRNLMRDFEREGSHLPKSTQAAKSTVQAEISSLESAFLHHTKSSRTLVKFRYDELESIPTALRPQRPENGMYEQVSEAVLSLSDLSTLLSNSKLESVRKRAFLALMSTCPRNELVLQSLVAKKTELARMLGHDTYTSFLMSHQMFPSANAEQTLRECYPHILQKLKNELGILTDCKARAEQEDRNSPVTLQPWDVPYYTKRFLGMVREHAIPRAAEALRAAKYFTLMNIMQGMQQLLLTTFDMHMVLSLAPAAESWSNDIIKAEIKLNSTGEVLGVLYFDLFQRPNKHLLSAAKLNIRCSKVKSVASTRHSKSVAVLVCGYPKVAGSMVRAALGDVLNAEIDYEEAKELFHEFGHALHAIASRTEFHCFSGTRVPLDFAEFPSNLFELFLTDYEFVKQWAVNKSTAQAIPRSLFTALVSSKKVFRALEHQSLLLKAIFDLKLHSSSDKTPQEVNESLMKDFPNLLYSEPSHNLRWYCSSEHLAEYGGSYYTYVLGQVLAESVWTRLFKGSALNRNAGSRLLRLVLTTGGEGNGSEVMGELLQGEQVKGERELHYAFEIDVWQEVSKWYQNFARDDELVGVDELKQVDTWKQMGGKLQNTQR